ncbi:hypothetical protein ETH_00033665, partial [Eimeria tenella]
DQQQQQQQQQQPTMEIRAFV